MCVTFGLLSPSSVPFSHHILATPLLRLIFKIMSPIYYAVNLQRSNGDHYRSCHVPNASLHHLVKSSQLLTSIRGHYLPRNIQLYRPIQCLKADYFDDAFRVWWQFVCFKFTNGVDNEDTENQSISDDEVMNIWKLGAYTFYGPRSTIRCPPYWTSSETHNIINSPRLQRTEWLKKCPHQTGSYFHSSDFCQNSRFKVAFCPVGHLWSHPIRYIQHLTSYVNQ